MRQRTPRERHPDHLAWIRTLPCLVCRDDTSVEAAHLRFTDRSAAKDNPGVGQKPHDYWTVPLCGKHHRAQHTMGNEQAFWAAVGIDPIRAALCLYVVSGDHERGTQIVQQARTQAK